MSFSNVYDTIILDDAMHVTKGKKEFFHDFPEPLPPSALINRRVDMDGSLDKVVASILGDMNDGFFKETVDERIRPLTGADESGIVSSDMTFVEELTLREKKLWVLFLGKYDNSSAVCLDESIELRLFDEKKFSGFCLSRS